MFSKILAIVFKKEIRETIRDRRTMLSTLLSPLIGAGLVFFLVDRIGDRASETKEVDLHVQGAKFAPDLVDRLKRQHITIKDAPEDPDDAIREQRITVLLTIPETYDRDLAQGRPVDLQLRADMSNSVSNQTLSRANAVISAYGSEIGALRLAARGVAMRMTRPFAVQQFDLATKEQRASMLTQMLLIFVLISAYVGGMYLTIDSTAGERERQSLEPLLCTPTSSLAVITGKWLAASLMSSLTCLITLLCLRQALYWSPFEELGINFELGMPQVFTIFGLIVPYAMLMSAIQLLIGIFSRNYREAQTYLGTFMMLPMLPTYLYDKDTGPPDLWMHAVPSLSQHIHSLAVLRGEAIAPLELTLGIGACLVLSPILLVLLSRMLRKEKIIYGR